MLGAVARALRRYPASLSVALICLVAYGAVAIDRPAALLDGRSAHLYALAFNAYFVLAGDWWRVVTAPLVHAGPAHLLNNVAVLLFMGTWLEEDLGRLRWLLVFVAGVVGAEAALAVAQPFALAVGCSGGLFALMGAGWAIERRHRLDAERARACVVVSLGTLGLNLLVPVSGSLYGHLGGAAVGLVLGLTVGVGSRRLAAIRRRREEAFERLASRPPVEPASPEAAAFVLRPAVRSYVEDWVVAGVVVAGGLAIATNLGGLSGLSRTVAIAVSLGLAVAGLVVAGANARLRVVVGPEGIEARGGLPGRGWKTSWDGLHTFYAGRQLGGLFARRCVGFLRSGGAGGGVPALGRDAASLAVRLEASRLAFTGPGEGSASALTPGDAGVTGPPTRRP